VPAKKTKNEMVEVSLVEITKCDSREKKRTVDGVSGKDVDIEFVGGIWKERKVKFPCPECHGFHTTIELSIQDIGWDGIGCLDKTGGGVGSWLGNFTISCDDCKKLFTYSPRGDIDLDFIEEVSYDELERLKRERSRNP
jgi:hypothetical protein